MVRGRQFALQCRAFRWSEAEIAIYAPFAGYPEPVIAECAGRTLIEVEDGPAILAPMPIAVATKSYHLARCYSRRDRLKSLNTLHLHTPDQIGKRIGIDHRPDVRARPRSPPALAARLPLRE